MEIVEIISTVGFPIFMCLWFIMKTEKVIDNNTKALNTNSSVLIEAVKRL